MTNREIFYDDESAIRATHNENWRIAKAILATGRYLGAELHRIGDELVKLNSPLIVSGIADELVIARGHEDFSYGIKSREEVERILGD